MNNTMMTQLADDATRAVFNHLWQSSIVVLAAAVVALALRHNRASARHAVWLAASLKFLLPFSLLIGLGGAFTWRTSTAQVMPIAPGIADTVQTITAPFAESSSVQIQVPAAPDARSVWWPAVLVSMWGSGCLVMVITRVRAWRSVRAALRASTAVTFPGVQPGVRVRATPGLLEPGVVGIWRPVLLVPVGLEESLGADQLRAVVLHEMQHVRRRDNLTSALHMAVEIAFWFHPLVWWVGARLIDERERACDEHVIASGVAPDAYAEGILNVCKRYIESPVACVSGVTGSDLKKRVGAILSQRVGADLPISRKALIVIAALVALAAPLAAGMLTAPLRTPQQAVGAFPKFDVVSVRPCDPSTPGQTRGGGGPPITSPGHLYLQCYPLSTMFTEAYVFFADGRAHALWAVTSVGVEGALDWMKSDRFTIEAKTDQNPAPAVMRGPMLQAVLEDRFKLKVHHETREMPIYELVVAKSGAKVSPYTGNDCVIKDDAAWPPPPLPAGQRYCGDQSKRDGDQFVRMGVMTLDQLAELFPFYDRPVVNKTGITAPVSFRLQYPIEGPVTGPEPPPASVVKALRDQLGLELRAAKGPRDFWVIDHADRPSPNDQQPAAAQKFEVASIRPCEPTSSVPGARNGGAGPVFSPGLLTVNCMTLEQMINSAYVANGDALLNDEGRVAVAGGGRDPKNFPDRIRGGPDWARTERFMIEAKTTVSTGASGRGAVSERAMLMGPMLRVLLEDRFKLQIHRDVQNDVAMYALTVAKTGLKIKPVGADGGCTPSDPNRTEPYRMDEEIAAVRNGGKPVCGHGIMGGDVGPNHALVLNGQTMAGVARWLSGVMDRHVLDQTGIDDKFVIYLEYAPDDAVPYDFKTAHEPADPPTAPTITQALKALGLELQPTKGPKGYIVIDHVERPSSGAPSRSH